MAFDLLAPFTGSAYSDAAQQQRDYFNRLGAQVGGQIAGAQGTGLDILRAGQGGALGAITGGFGTAASNVGAATPQALAALYGGSTGATGALTDARTGGLAALRSGVDTATGAYAPVGGIAGQYAGYTTGASQAQADALGLNGPEGIARSRAAFQTSPGYQFSLEQGIQGITRGANVGGMAAGGNTLRAAGEYATNAANQEWNNYLAQLQARQGTYAPLALSGVGTAAGGVANAALAGGTGAANIYTGTGQRLSDILYGTGTAGAGIYTGQGQTLADLAARGGLAAGSVYTGSAQQQADLVRQLTGTQVGFEQNLAPQYGSTYGTEAAAATGGAGNLWNLGLAGLSAAGGGGFLGTGLQSYFNRPAGRA
jgi:hypothetical protein